MTEQILYSYVYVDEPHLSEICINIISNAVKYTDAGYGWVRYDINHPEDEG